MNPRLQTTADLEIETRLERVRDRIAAAARRAGRDRSSVTLVLASKTQPPEAIRAAYLAGAREFGENYVQEAAGKRAAVEDLEGIRWHLLGHLQTNKAGLAARCFDIIETLDSQRVADALAAARSARAIPALVEVNLAREPSKAGVAPDGVEPLINAVRDRVSVQGLMAIPPASADASVARGYFAGLRVLRDRLAALTGLALSELSMGMSEDFEIAIEEGATIVRIGRAVFGERGRKL